MNRHLLAAICGLTLIASAGLVAQRAGSITRPDSGLIGPTFAQQWRPANMGGSTKIIGTVTPLVSASPRSVRLPST